jgi:hypothetical protein
MISSNVRFLVSVNIYDIFDIEQKLKNKLENAHHTELLKYRKYYKKYGISFEFLDDMISK